MTPGPRPGRLRIAARQLPPSSTPETVRLSVPDDLTSLPPGFSAEGAGGRPFLVLVKKTAGGTDIPSRMLRRKYPHINMTTFILFFNLVIIVTFAILFHRFDSCMYTLICMYITNKVESLLLYGPVNSRLCYIISDKSADLSSAITGRLHRGVTLLDGHGAWSGKSERVIMCAVKPGQLGPLRRMVREIDPKSFLIVGDARTIYGHGFESIEED